MKKCVMKKILLLLASILFSLTFGACSKIQIPAAPAASTGQTAVQATVVPTKANSPDPGSEDFKAVKKACLDYVEGYFESSEERVKDGVHPELVKREINKGPLSKSMSKDELVAVTIKSKREKPDIKVEVFDIEDKNATAKVINPAFFDYCHLAKTDGKWQVVNVLWGNYPKK